MHENTKVSIEPKNSIVIYNTWYMNYKRLLDHGKESEALQYIQAIMEYGFTGQLPAEDSEVWLYGFDNVIESMDNCAVRYSKAIDNGRKGGRPKKILDESEVIEKYKELKTWKATAKYFEVAETTLRNMREEWEKREKITEKTEKQKNLNYNVNENVDFPESKEKESDDNYQTPDDYFNAEQIHDIDWLYSQNKSAAEIARLLNIDEYQLTHHWVWREQPDKPKI